MTQRTSGQRARSATTAAAGASNKPEPGSRRADLEAIRERLLADLPRAYGSQLAAIARELRIVAQELEQMRPKEATLVDEIAKRRAKRRAKAAAAERS